MWSPWTRTPARWLQVRLAVGAAAMLGRRNLMAATRSNGFQQDIPIRYTPSRLTERLFRHRFTTLWVPCAVMPRRTPAGHRCKHVSFPKRSLVSRHVFGRHPDAEKPAASAIGVHRRDVLTASDHDLLTSMDARFVTFLPTPSFAKRQESFVNKQAMLFQ